MICDAFERPRAASNPPRLWQNRSVACRHQALAQVIEILDAASS